MKKDILLFKKLDKITLERFKRFEKYYLNDSKPFINKLKRDYEKSNKFPLHVLKMIKKIPKDKYDSAVCILRGGLPYSLLFEAYGWKLHYVICGRRNEQINPGIMAKRYNQSIDKTLKDIKGKKVLLVENNSYNGTTTIRVIKELKKYFNIQKPDMFLDYYVDPIKYPHLRKFSKDTFLKYSDKIKRNYGKIYAAKELKVSEKEREKLVEEFLELID